MRSIVAGASGDPEYGKLHRAWVTNLVNTLRERYKIEPAHLTVLVEQPQAGEDRATAENVRAALTRLAKQMTADDLLFVMLIGHGGGNAAEAKFNLVGPDLTVAEWSGLLKPLPGRIAFVNASSASYAFLKGLAVARADRHHRDRFAEAGVPPDVRRRLRSGAVGRHRRHRQERPALAARGVRLCVAPRDRAATSSRARCRWNTRCSTTPATAKAGTRRAPARTRTATSPP